MLVGLIMAGGASERMRASGSTLHKALVPVFGVPLIERNLLGMLAAGISDIVVAVNAQEAAIGDYVNDRARTLTSERGGQVHCLIEPQPLGTIGAAACVLERNTATDAVVVVNVDNLTALDLAHLAQTHRASGAALTIATHREPIRLPFGEVVVADGRITDYVEKPTLWREVSSGTSVLSPEACRAIPRNRRVDLPDLFRILTQRGCLIRAFAHASPWVDVNDMAAVTRAERMLDQHREQFE